MCLRPQHTVRNCINLAHQRTRARERGDDFAVVRRVVEGQRAAFAILEPLFADLIPTLVEPSS